MSETDNLEDADYILRTRGAGHELGAWAIGAAFSADGKAAGFALGDGTVHLADPKAPEGAWRRLEAHDGACLSMVADAGSGFLSGGDDGKLLRIAADGTTSTLANFGMM